ncbi:MAG TPA: alpha/beta hydrolase [Steroidobacteraceae bacterium]|jgi:acetyl esterase/lipase|nr:alpha/beta hydrolase [Steroidobacteraceae bacterium]
MNRKVSARAFRRFIGLAGLGALILSAAAIYSPAASAKEKYKIDPVTGTKYKADPDMQDLLAAYAGLGGKPIETLTPTEARGQPTMADAVIVVMKQRGIDTDPAKLVPDVTTVDVTIPGQSLETPLSATVYTPVGPGPFPAVVYFHGGGWVIGSRKADDAGARALAKGADAVVISVDYPLAPEHKFPAPWDGALAAYKWVASNVGSWRGDPRRLALAGEDAGGNLALATAIATADAGLTRPKAVIAIDPITQTGSATESYVDSANAKVLDKAMMAWFFSHTLSSPAEKTNPRLDLLHAKLTLLPPVTIINAQIDPLRSDGSILEEALKQAGIPVTRQEYPGVTHDFFDAAPVLPAAKKAQSFASDQLKAVFKP